MLFFSSHYVATSIWYELILNYLVLLTLLDPGFLSYCNPQGVGSGQITQDLKYRTHTKNPPYNCFLPKSSQFLFLLLLLMAWQFSCPICRQKVVKKTADRRGRRCQNLVKFADILNRWSLCTYLRCSIAFMIDIYPPIWFTLWKQASEASRSSGNTFQPKVSLGNKSLLEKWRVG